jgi:hypothetical protein
MNFVAICHIRKGDPLNISVDIEGLLDSKEQRHDRLQPYGASYQCSSCPSDSSDSDKRRRQIREALHGVALPDAAGQLQRVSG